MRNMTKAEKQVYDSTLNRVLNRLSKDNHQPYRERMFIAQSIAVEAIRDLRK